MYKGQYTVILTEPAVQDLIESGKYIADNFLYEELVWAFIDKIEEYVSKLSMLPYRLPKAMIDYDNESIYYRSFKNYLFFIKIDEVSKRVYILRILHEGTNWEFQIKRYIIEKNKNT